MYDYTMPSMGTVDRRRPEFHDVPPPGRGAAAPDLSSPPSQAEDPPTVQRVPPFPLPSGAGPDGLPVPPGPVYPVSGYCTVRFLNADMDLGPIRALIGDRVAAGGLDYGGIGPYWRVREGFRTVAITSAIDPRPVLYCRSVPFGVNELLTLAVVRGSGGLELARISDAPCRDRPQDPACLRAVDLLCGRPAVRPKGVQGF